MSSLNDFRDENRPFSINNDAIDHLFPTDEWDEGMDSHPRQTFSKVDHAILTRLYQTNWLKQPLIDSASCGITCGEAWANSSIWNWSYSLQKWRLRMVLTVLWTIRASHQMKWRSYEFYRKLKTKLNFFLVPEWNMQTLMLTRNRHHLYQWDGGLRSDYRMRKC